MSEKILVPVLGESINEATVAKWLKKKGDKVSADEPIVELETDKVNLEVPAPTDGTIAEINSNDGETVEVGSVLGIISDSNEPSVEIKKVKPTPKKENEDKKSVLNLDLEKKEPKIFEDKEEDALLLTDEVNLDNKKNTNKTLSPAVRKIVTEKKINIETVKGTGKGGRILKGDLISLMGESPKPNQRKIQFGHEERIKMTRLRQTIAKRLKDAQNNAALLTTFNEVDMTEIISMRKENQDDFQNRFGIKLGFMSFFVKACIVGLKSFPAINAEVEGEEIIYKNYYNISFAVGTDRGLVVPVLRDPDEMSFADIEKNIGSLGEKARNGNITIEDLQGGTFTITNGGIYGSMLSTPILNPPQSGVLGMHNIIERPVARNGSILIRPMMYLALSYDHRIIDGKEAVSFLKNVKDLLEEPERLFLNV